ncbi:hypothetical protein GCM10012275_11820 [Longimycelium tulufanense]|uniref:Uncharacterized protein n=2 Tax=Longimycelium tulufanense TaxID=907463 RepID=A0A8J3FT42_9PSEU|nr:hypothetical protein GCM10012275_11820 [Longimycelium tulufanense]
MLHPHRVSYYRVVRVRRVLVAVEDVDDYGFYLGWNRKREPVSHTAEPYAAALLEDHLAARSWPHRPKSGERWRVVVERIRDGDLEWLCEAAVSVQVINERIATHLNHVHGRACRCGRTEAAS